MNKFTIYCTPEQAKKAIMLGAPLETYTGHLANGRYILHGFECYKIPTADEMIGWLESIPIFKCINVYCIDNWRYSVNIKVNCLEGKDYLNRKDATLDAIDEALGYMLRMKEIGLLDEVIEEMRKL